jgi:glycosyltransferase involved in cell wall biosynthesis
MPNAVLEYMAAGRPIVATNVGAVGDLLEDGIHGLVVPPANPDRIAAGIDHLLQAPAFAQQLGEAARMRAITHYSRGGMVRRFEDFYLGIARRGVNGERSPSA